VVHAPRLSTGIAASAGSVFDDELLTELFGQPLTHQTGVEVIRAASWKADDDFHRPRRIGLRRCAARHGQERGGARCQMQELSSVGKFHWRPPP
jgi:hypothetical protein